MKYLEKVNNINCIVSEINKVVNFIDIEGSLYVDSDYFKDSYELGIEALPFYLVSDLLDKDKSISLELELNSISTNYVFNVIDSETFENNFERETTKIV